MDSHIDTHTGVILPVSTTAYGLLLHKDSFGDGGQTRVKHHEKRRKTPGFLFIQAGLLESLPTFGGLPDFWKVRFTNTIKVVYLSHTAYLSCK
jgi:hypothetical protein